MGKCCSHPPKKQTNQEKSFKLTFQIRDQLQLYIWPTVQDIFHILLYLIKLGISKHWQEFMTLKVHQLQRPILYNFIHRYYITKIQSSIFLLSWIVTKFIVIECSKLGSNCFVIFLHELENVNLGPLIECNNWNIIE